MNKDNPMVTGGKPLHRLLTKLFECKNLILFLETYPGGDEILAELSESQKSTVSTLAQYSIKKLQRRGWINRAFFDRLVTERANMLAEIETVAELWGVTSVQTQTNQTPSPTQTTGTQVAAPIEDSRATERIDVGIVTMKEEEFLAVLDQLGEHSRLPPPKTRRYEEATVRAGSGSIRVAVTRSEQGNGPAQETVDLLIRDLKPSFVLVVGIAGAPPTEDLTLGDVVVSSYIHDLTLQDTGTDADGRRFNARGGSLHKEAEAIAGHLKAIERRQLGWQDAINQGRPSFTGTHTTTDNPWNAKIDEAFAWHAKNGRQQPIVTAQPIGASDLLVKDPKYVQQWKTVLKGIAAIEMESAGAHRASSGANVPFLAIRGISDIIGWKRDEAWTHYACHSAAAFMMALLRSGELLPR